QSGKTTLAKQCFPDYHYINLELPDTRAYVLDDPRTFLNSYKNGVIFDEVQNVPEIFSYIQVMADESNQTGRFILTGSQNFLLLEKISQSLAGRVAIVNLFPFTVSEIKKTGFNSASYSGFIYNGSYPGLYDKNIQPLDFYPSYLQTYLERDVRSIINVGNLLDFRTFLGLVAGRTGQIVNYASLANDVGVDQKTVKKWLSVLEASFIVFFLRTYHKNFNKRLIKSPKLYFYDTGLVCSLLGIKSAEEVSSHFLKGALFENFVISETARYFFNKGIRPDLYYWRDNTGNEVDCIVKSGLFTKIIEIKSGATLNTSFFKGLDYYRKLSGLTSANFYLVYGGDENQIRSGAKVFSWKSFEDLFSEL
ncbi:MAG: ATP-binding protein, partial [Bacteroidales bacterium]|nr:ATP-binding protein [Bacteroidales bacterium]